MEMDIGHRIGLQLTRGADFADCTFLVNGQTIEAHRVILAAASPVFETMLTPPWGKQGQQVNVEDITYDDFMDVLNFCYSDCITFRSIDHAGDLLYAFNKYMIFQASDKCRSYLRANIRIDTAHKIYKICDKLNEESIGNVAFMHICQYPSVILNEHVDDIDGPLLKKIVNSDRLNMGDVYLIEYVWKWARNVIRKRNMSLKKRHNVRKILVSEGILSSIRFLVLTPQEYQYCERYLRTMLYFKEITFVKSYMGTEEEEIPDKTMNNLSYIKLPRLMINVSLISIQRMIVYPMRFIQMTYNTILKVGIKSDSTILLRGFVIPSRTTNGLGDLAGYPTYHEHILFKIQQHSDETMVPYMGSVRHTVAYDTLQHVFFAQPLLIKRNEWYVFEFSWQGLESDVFYKADSCVTHTQAGAVIKYRDQIDDDQSNQSHMYFGHSFLKGVKYNM